MIKYYQELVNECIDLTDNMQLYKNMLLTLNTMKNKLKKIERRENAMLNTKKNLEKLLTNKNDEIQKLKEKLQIKNKQLFTLTSEVYDSLSTIIKITERNNYGNSKQKNRKIIEEAENLRKKIYDYKINDIFNGKNRTITTYHSNI